jgi:endonuclease/exonuclease/phosphatase family metal-dependent hydrolase
MKIATFNVESLFRRPSAMNLDTWDDGRPALTDVSDLNSLLALAKYDAKTKAKIKKLLDKYEFWNNSKADRPFEIQEVRERLYKVPKGKKETEVVADGRDSWVGWVELRRDEIAPEATTNTGRVVDAVRPDILCVVEVEDRITLQRFNDQILAQDFSAAYEYNLLVDGNDPRGVDIGLLSHHPIGSVRSHIQDGGTHPIFSRDCPEFEIVLPSGKTLWVLGNHLKSKGYGSQQDSDKRREKQAIRVAEIYAEARKRSDFVIVAGDFNDFPTSAPLKPLVVDTDLADAMTHPSYQGLPGTYGTGSSEKQKIDYVLLSPALFAKVSAVGVERRGVWSSKPQNRFPEVTVPKEAASDHACMWVEVNIS